MGVAQGMLSDGRSRRNRIRASLPKTSCAVWETVTPDTSGGQIGGQNMRSHRVRDWFVCAKAMNCGIGERHRSAGARRRAQRFYREIEEAVVVRNDRTADRKIHVVGVERLVRVAHEMLAREHFLVGEII